MSKLRFSMKLRHIAITISELDRRGIIPKEYLIPVSIGNGTIELPAERLPACKLFFDEDGIVILILQPLMDILDASAENKNPNLEKYFKFLIDLEESSINCLIIGNE